MLPAVVNSAGRGPRGRSKSATPAARSSWRICWLTADCVKPSCSAAAVNVPASTTATRAANWRGSALRSVGMNISITNDYDQIAALLVMIVPPYPQSWLRSLLSNSPNTSSPTASRSEGRAHRAVPHRPPERRQRCARFGRIRRRRAATCASGPSGASSCSSHAPPPDAAVARTRRGPSDMTPSKRSTGSAGDSVEDPDGACELVTDDVEYDNVPMGKNFGPTGSKHRGGWSTGSTPSTSSSIARLQPATSCSTSAPIASSAATDLRLPVVGVFELPTAADRAVA